MNRTRLALLVSCALFSTSIQPLAWIDRDAQVESSPIVQKVLPAVSANAPSNISITETRDADTISNQTALTDEVILARLLHRLSIRHTGLPERGRLRVAKAILQEARVHDLDPDLVIAVIEVESAGYHLAVSHVGAMGLMQLLPSTGKELAGKLDIEWMGDDTLFDPVINIKLGTAYLRELADRFGDVQVALAAYNWGPGRIDRRLRRGATVPSKYIEQVMRAYTRHTTALTTRRS